MIEVCPQTAIFLFRESLFMVVKVVLLYDTVSQEKNLPAGHGSTNTSISSMSQMSLLFVLNTQERSVILRAGTSDHVEAESTSGF